MEKKFLEILSSHGQIMAFTMAKKVSGKNWPEMAKVSFMQNIIKKFNYGPYGLALLKWQEDDEIGSWRHFCAYVKTMYEYEKSLRERLFLNIIEENLEKIW